MLYPSQLRPTVGKLRLADINFVGLVLNRNITKKLRLYFIVKVLTCVVFVSLFTSFN